MRRVILAVTGTIAGLVALLSFKSHVPSAPVAATTGGSGGTSSSSSPASSSSSGGGQTEVVPGAFPQGSIAKNLPAGETAVDGKVANTSYGPVQIQLIKRAARSSRSRSSCSRPTPCTTSRSASSPSPS